jgi:putative transposase
LRAKPRGGQAQFALPFPDDLAGRKRFWRRRYYDFNVYSEKRFREKLDYMHMNPVKRGLVNHSHDWLWSRWRFYERGEGLIAMDKWE